MEIIKSVSEITGNGQYRFSWLSEIITIDQELNKKDELEYCIQIGNFLVMKGWKAAKWRTIEGVQKAIDLMLLEREYGLYPEPPKRMTLQELKTLAKDRGYRV